LDGFGPVPFSPLDCIFLHEIKNHKSVYMALCRTGKAESHMDMESGESPYDAEHGRNVYGSYDLGKAHFEDVLHFAQIKGANAYYHQKWDGDFVLETESGIQQMFRNLYFLFSDEVCDKNGESVGGSVLRKGNFVARWLKDPQRREYVDILSDPNNSDPSFKNIWPGFRAERLAAVEAREEVEALSAPIVEHLRGLLYGVEAHVQFVLQWLAFQVQRPGDKTQVALIFYGDQGVGKGILFEWVGQKLFGDQLYVQTDTMRSILGDYATLMKNKKLCQYDEVSIADTRPVIHRLKNLITVPKLTFNPKHKAEFSLKCMANYVFTTNSVAPMPVEATDRRFAAFYCSEARMQDKGYFDRLSDHMADERVQRAFYQYLLEHVSLEGVGRDLQQQRPVTQYYKDLQQQELKPLMRWLSVLCHRSAGGAQDVDCEYQKVFSGALFERFKTWLGSNYPREVEFLKGPQFGKDLKDLCCKGLAERPEGTRFTAGGLEYVKSGGATTYGFRFRELEEHLKKWSFFDYNIDH